MGRLGQPDRAGIEARLRIVERKLDLIMRALGVAEDPSSDPMKAEIRDLVANGRTIEAIKVYRERTGAGLAEAKAAVDAIQ